MLELQIENYQSGTISSDMPNNGEFNYSNFAVPKEFLRAYLES